MPDAIELVKTIKKTSLEAMESAKPVQICFGQVLSISPLRINIEQKMILTEAQLILSRNVTDFKTTITIEWESEKILKEDIAEHLHQIIGKKDILIQNALKVGEEVILFRQQGGQKYIVIDRIGGKK